MLNDYPLEFFNKFWTELLEYSPDFIDEMNHSLYWKISNCKEIFNNFDDILNRYMELNIEDKKLRDINKLKEQIKELENS